MLILFADMPEDLEREADEERVEEEPLPVGLLFGDEVASSEAA